MSLDDNREQIETRAVRTDYKEWVKKYKDYDDQVLLKFSSTERVKKHLGYFDDVADDSQSTADDIDSTDMDGDCCESEEDEINFYHEEAGEKEDSENLAFPTGPNPKAPGASPKTGGAPSPKHYRKIKFTDNDNQSPSDPKDHQCEEGMTELGGWMICKHCGANLRKI